MYIMYHLFTFSMYNTFVGLIKPLEIGLLMKKKDFEDLLRKIGNMTISELNKLHRTVSVSLLHPSKKRILLNKIELTRSESIKTLSHALAVESNLTQID